MLAVRSAPRFYALAGQWPCPTSTKKSINLFFYSTKQENRSGTKTAEQPQQQLEQTRTAVSDSGTHNQSQPNSIYVAQSMPAEYIAPPSPAQQFYAKSLARARNFPLEEKPLQLTEWERTWERWIKDNDEWEKKLREDQPRLFKPTPFQRKLLVWTGVFDSLEHVPEKVSTYAVRKKLKWHFNFFFYSLLLIIFINWMHFSSLLINTDRDY